MNRDDIISSGKRILEEFNYGTDHIEDVIDASLAKKESLRKLFSHHPNWNEEKGWIAFEVDSNRKVDVKNIHRFSNWVEDHLNSITDGQKAFKGSLINLIYDQTEQFADDEYAEKANKVAVAFGKKPTFKAGQKTSRIVNKLCQYAELDKIEDIRTESFVDDYGITHEREKNYGYNYIYALYADSINPLTVRRHTIISINPCDYWTMSLGDNWTSCHTIDKRNYRGIGANHWQGCYSGGTESYMLDQTSFVFYYVRASYDGTDYEFEPKQKRCMFFWGEDKLVQSRVYPDGRDGGDFGISQEIRNIVQKVIADCLNVPNLWKLKKGTHECREVIDSCGLQYKDYFQYNDCNVSYLRKGDGLNTKSIKIGAEPIICPSCGDTHYTESCISCEGCYDDSGHTCNHCGAWIAEDEGYSDEYCDYYFCDLDCAEREGWCLPENDDYLCRIDDCIMDDYDGKYYYNNYETVRTEDDTFYGNEENAENAGYVETVDGLWYLKEDCEDTVDGYVYRAEENGYVYCEDTHEWIKQEDAYYYEDAWHSSEEEV